MIETLRGSLLTHVDFSLGSLHVRRAVFAEVAGAVADGRIIVAISEDGTFGEYNSETDTIWLPGSGSNRNRAAALTVHEAVHAWLDIHRATGTSMQSEEAIAYLAQVIYLRWRDPNDNLLFEPIIQPVINECLEIIAANRMESVRGVTLRRRDISELRSLIATVYPSRFANRHDGLFRRAREDRAP